MDGGLVSAGFQVAVDTVVTGIDQPAFEPFVAGCVTGIQDLVPVFVPGEQFRVFRVTVREIVQAEPVIDGWIGQVGLSDEFGGRIVVRLFLPVDSDLGFRGFDNIFSAHATLLFYGCNYLKQQKLFKTQPGKLPPPFHQVLFKKSSWMKNT
jgi:hypothetical protein